MAVADAGASHVILPMTALHDDKSAKQVSLRFVAGEIAAVVRAPGSQSQVWTKFCVSQKNKVTGTDTTPPLFGSCSAVYAVVPCLVCVCVRSAFVLRLARAQWLMM